MLTAQQLRQKGYREYPLHCGHARWIPATVKGAELQKYLAVPCGMCKLARWTERKGKGK
ncbi:MAG TPA: hypothetical protein VGA01_12150 [Candidatus Binatia bacterium]